MSTSKFFVTVSFFSLLLSTSFGVVDMPCLYSGLAYMTGDGPCCVIAIDLNGDGNQDIAVANAYSDDISIFINKGDGTLEQSVNYAVAHVPSAIFASDFDGDGDEDLAVANNNSDSVSILLNNGNGTFRKAVNYRSASGPCAIFAIDLDNDSRIDLAVANQISNNISILRGNGDGTFQSAVYYEVGNGPCSVIAVDLDGGGAADLAVVNHNSNNVSILKNNGDGTFGPAVNCAVGNDPRCVIAADFDNNGYQDLVVTNFGSWTVSLLQNKADGTFQPGVDYVVAQGPRSAAAADFDKDGHMDLAVANEKSGNISILRNIGDGRFQPSMDFEEGDLPHSVFAADFDHDGDKDIVIVDMDRDYASFLWNNGDGTFRARVNYYVRTKAAVMEDDQGRVILSLWAPNTVSVEGDSTSYKLKCEVEGWIKESIVTKIGQTMYRLKGDATLPRLQGGTNGGIETCYVSRGLWTDQRYAKFPWLLKSIDGGINWYDESIGKVQDQAEMITPEETCTTSVLDDGVHPVRYLKVKIKGWIRNEFVTPSFADTQVPGEIRGRVVRHGVPISGIFVRMGGVVQQTGDEGEYRFLDLPPNREYGIGILKDGKWYTNLFFNLPVLDPGERLRYGDIDVDSLKMSRL